MKPIRRVLVGIRDLEAQALPAVRKGAALAEAFGAQLALFHAMAVPVTALPSVYRAGGFRNFERGLQQAAVNLLIRHLRRPPGAGADVPQSQYFDYELVIRHSVAARQ
jgi:hypothetical protein